MLPPAQVLAHPAVYLCGGGWLFFVAENAVLSENRQVFIDRLGDRGYKSCYGLLSTCSLASVAYGLWRHGPGPRLRTVGTPSLALGSALLVSPGRRVQPGPGAREPHVRRLHGLPADLKAVRADRASWAWTARGIAVLSLGFLGLGCAAMTPFAGTAAAALGFPLVALVGGTHLDSRHRRGMGGRSRERETGPGRALRRAARGGGRRAAPDELSP